MSVLISGNGLGQVLVLASCVVSVGLRGVVQYEIEMWLKDKAIKWRPPVEGASEALDGVQQLG